MTQFERLQKWENDLHICIRCGYCYEHCPFYKMTGWESDTPRGKLLVAFGLMNGTLEPSQEIADKFFECFYCQNCYTSCSSKVPVTEIMSDIRADLIELGFEPGGTTAANNEDICGRCQVCVPICKEENITLVEDEDGTRKIVVDSAKCQGCGTCIAACPSGAMYQRAGYEITPKELKAKVQHHLKQENSNGILAFCCNWSVYPGMQLSRFPGWAETPCAVVINMCSGRLDPEIILEAFKLGARGILVAACPPDECEHNGNYKTTRRILALKNVLQQLNINPDRLRLERVKTGEKDKTAGLLKDFCQQVEQLAH